MFMDGQQYACVSKNLSEGYGSWWFPYLSDGWWKADSAYFMEHPPMVYWIQAAYFKVLGSSMYTERVFSFSTALMTAFLIHLIWKLLFIQNEKLQKWSGLPMLLWIIVPVCFWGYQHNIQENTMTIFCLLAVYFFLKGESKGLRMYLWMLGSAVFIVCAFLCKGPPGLFPLAVIFCFWLGKRDVSFGWMALNSFVLIVMVMSIFLVLTLNDAAKESLTFYIDKRLLFRVEHEPVVSSRFAILWRLIMEILPSLAVGFVTLGIVRILKLKADYFQHYKWALVFAFIALSASLPLMLTPVQRGFYLHPSWPFFGLSLGLFILPGAEAVINHLQQKNQWKTVMNSFSVLILVTAVSLTVINIGQTRRDHDSLHDVYLIGEQLPERCQVKVNAAVYEAWDFNFYMMRYFGVSLMKEGNADFRITPKLNKEQEESTWIKLKLDTKKYDLWQKKG